MRKYNGLRRVLRSVPALLAWAMLVLVIWGFVFLRLTDTDTEHKLVVYFDCELKDATALMLDMEEQMGVGGKLPYAFSERSDIRMIKARPFTYNMMGDSLDGDGDLFVVAEGDMEVYSDWFEPLPNELTGGRALYLVDGAALGVCVGEPATGVYLFKEIVDYDLTQRYYLCLCVNSVHAGDADKAALELAETLLADIEKQ